MAEKTQEQIRKEQEEVIKKRQEHEKQQQEAEKKRQEEHANQQPKPTPSQGHQTQSRRSADGTTPGPLDHLDEQQIRRLKIERPDLFLETSAKPIKVTARSEVLSAEARGVHDDKVGELAPGQLGWLPLDDAGKPSGPATLLPPTSNIKACRVMANPAGSVADLLTTNTGAPITDAMQPQTDYYVFGAEPGGDYAPQSTESRTGPLKTREVREAKENQRVAG